MNVVPLHPSAASQWSADVLAHERDLRVRQRSPLTILYYRDSLRTFERFLIASGRDLATSRISKRDVQDYLLDQQERVSPGTVLARFRALRVFLNWAVREEIIDVSPMDGMQSPATQEKPPAILTLDQVAAIIKACEGRAFEDRRDMAIICLLIDTGMRRAEVGDLSVVDVDIDQQFLRVVGKGNKVRLVPFGDKTAQAFSRYERLRKTHRFVGLPQWWLSDRGAIGPAGIAWVVERRAKKAGVGHVHPHQFRHTFAHQQKIGGVPDEVIERVAGWAPNSPMLTRYGASAASERARDLYRQHRSPVDRL